MLPSENPTLDSPNNPGPAPTIVAGRTLAGRYQLARQLGEGAFGQVWLARDLTAQGDVVVKVLHSNWARVPEVVERFRREAQASQRIVHGSACKVFEFAVTEDRLFFITMEYLDGGTLKEELARVGRMALARVAHWMVPVCDAVGSAHRAGIVHRDLKPENIMLRRDGGAETPVVLDFGIAKLLDADQKLTQTGSILGSPAYMSPEQSMGQSDIGPAADVYSLAIITFELASGAPPFVSRSFAELAVRHAHDPPPRLEGVPPALSAMVDRCLAKDPAARPPVTELAAAIAAAGLRQSGTQERPPGADRVAPVRVDSHSAPTMLSRGNKELDEAMRRLAAAPPRTAPVAEARRPLLSRPPVLAAIAVGLALFGALLGVLFR